MRKFSLFEKKMITIRESTCQKILLNVRPKHYYFFDAKNLNIITDENFYFKN